MYGTDGIALEYQGANDLVENNFFEYNDWSGANMNVAGGGKNCVQDLFSFFIVRLKGKAMSNTAIIFQLSDRSIVPPIIER